MRFRWRGRWLLRSNIRRKGMRPCGLIARRQRSRRFRSTHFPIVVERANFSRSEGCGSGGKKRSACSPRAKWEALAHKLDRLGDYRPEAVIEESGVIPIDPRDCERLAAI